MVAPGCTANRWKGQGESAGRDMTVAQRAVRITAETPHGEWSDRLAVFRGLLALVKLLNLIGIKQAFCRALRTPEAGTEAGPLPQCVSRP